VHVTAVAATSSRSCGPVVLRRQYPQGSSAMAELTVPEDVQTLAARLAEPRLMRRGSASERCVRFNRPGCPCAEDSEARDGPDFSVSRVVKGETESRWLRVEQAQTRALCDGRSKQVSSFDSRSTLTGRPASGGRTRDSRRPALPRTRRRKVGLREVIAAEVVTEIYALVGSRVDEWDLGWRLPSLRGGSVFTNLKSKNYFHSARTSTWVGDVSFDAALAVLTTCHSPG